MVVDAAFVDGEEVGGGDDDEDLGFVHVQVQLSELRKMGVEGKGVYPFFLDPSLEEADRILTFTAFNQDLQGTDDEATSGKVTLSFEVLAVPPDDPPAAPPFGLAAWYVPLRFSHMF